MQELKANTAVDVLIGPFIDETDGITSLPALTLNAADILLSKLGQGLTLKTDATAAAADSIGYYNCELDATDTGSEGTLTLVVHKTSALPVRHEYMVLSEAAWDSKYAAKDTGFMSVNVDTIKTQTVTCAAGVTVNPSVGAATIVPTNTQFEARSLVSADYVVVGDTIAGVTLVDTVTTYTGNTLQTADVATLITTVGVAGAGLTNINLPNQTMDIVGDITGNLSGTVGSVTGAVGSVTGAVGSVTGAVGSVAGNVDGLVTGTVAGKTPAEAGDLMGLANDAITSAKFDESTAHPVTTAMQLAGSVIATGTVSHDNTPATTTVIYCDDITTVAADHWNGRLIIFTSGTLLYQATDITDYALDTGEGKFTVTALTSAPADNVTFVIV